MRSPARAESADVRYSAARGTAACGRGGGSASAISATLTAKKASSAANEDRPARIAMSPIGRRTAERRERDERCDPGRSAFRREPRRHDRHFAVARHREGQPRKGDQRDQHRVGGREQRDAAEQAPRSRPDPLHGKCERCADSPQARTASPAQSPQATPEYKGSS